MLTLSPGDASLRLSQLIEYDAISKNLNTFKKRPTGELMPLRKRRLWLLTHIPANLFKFYAVCGRFPDLCQTHQWDNQCPTCESTRTFEWFPKNKKPFCVTCANCDAVLAIHARGQK